MDNVTLQFTWVLQNILLLHFNYCKIVHFCQPQIFANLANRVRVKVQDALNEALEQKTCVAKDNCTGPIMTEE